MTDLAPDVPDVGELRTQLRRARRSHSDKTFGEFLTDVYLVAFVAVLYGGSGLVWARRVLTRPLTIPTGTAAERAWLVAALLIVVGALAWRGLRAAGPLLVTPAALVWCVSAPIDRARWLRLPLRITLALAAVVGAGTGVIAAWAGLPTADLLWTAVAGASAGAILAGAAVVAQGRGTERGPWSSVVLGVGVLLAAVVIATDLELPLPRPPMLAVAAIAVVGAVLVVRESVRALPHIDRTTLTAGAQLGAAAMSAAVMLDPSLISNLIAARRFRYAGKVHSRRWRRGPRWWVLLQADVRRQGRRRPALATWGSLILVPYAVGVFAPVGIPPTRVVAAYLAADRLAAGLRSVSRSAPLRRLLGGTDGELRAVHLAVPALGLVVWWGVAAPASVVATPILDAVLLLGVLGGVYRTATRRPMVYDGGLADSPFGPISTGLIRQLVRGPDVIAILALAAFILTPTP